MAGDERIQLDHQPGWVEVRTRWTYGDKVAIGLSQLPEGQKLLFRLVTRWHRGEHPTTDELNGLDDRDVEKIIARLVELRTAQTDDTAKLQEELAMAQAMQQAQAEP